jgi:SAM-dependent methyltransferase
MYGPLAHLYDWEGSLDFADKILVRDLAIFKQIGLVPPSRILDLACGTGTVAMALGREGFEVIGIDLSEAMLAEARRKQEKLDPKGTLRLSWRRGDMRTFLLDAPVDVVLCHYDSLNHLSNETELRATFLQVAQALKPGGLFLFDLNTLENFETFWNGSDSDEGPNYRLRTTSCFNPDSGKAEVTFHVDEYTEDGELLGRDETVYEQYFNETAVEKYLMAADFYEPRWEPFNPVAEIPVDFPLKTFWQCRRR